MSGLFEWVMDLPCGCRAARPSRKNHAPDRRFAWRIQSAAWTCEFGHRFDVKLPYTPRVTIPLKGGGSLTVLQ